MTVAEGPWGNSADLGDGGDGTPPCNRLSDESVSEVMHSLHEDAIDGLAGALDLCRDEARTLWERFVASDQPATPGQPVSPEEASSSRPTAGHGRPRLRAMPAGPALADSPQQDASERAGLRSGVHDLEGLRRRATEGDPGATRRQHAKEKLTARERLDVLLDAGSFVELGQFARHRAHGFGLDDHRPFTDGVITGWGTIDDRVVFVYAHDFRCFGGTLGEVFASKVHRVMDMAEAVGAPLIGLNDGGGARIQEGIAALAGYGGIFRRNVRASGVVPQISVVLGPCAGGAVYSPALTDFVFMVEGTANMFTTGPDVVEAATGERVGLDELGGTVVHSTRTGVASFVARDELSCLEQVRYLLSFLPANNLELPPTVLTSDDPDRRCEALLDIVPESPKQSYDMRRIVGEVVDDQEFLELCAGWASNVVCGFGRLGGRVVGVVGNQPCVLAGVLDIDASEKAARFVRMCDAFNIPLVTFVDVPGFLPGTAQEHGGIIRHGAKLLYAYCEATVPRLQVIVRKAYGGAYIVMDSKSVGADLSFAWAGNQVAVMGAEGAANIIFRRELSNAADPNARRAQLVEEYTSQLMHPMVAAERGFVDDVIDPRDTRRLLIRSLAMLADKREALPKRKHGNIPL